MKKIAGKSTPAPLKPAGKLHHYLLRWFDAEKRAMPWRETRDPYAIWLSETMLQQTQVETVKPYYHRFLEAFPTVRDLAKADLQEVLGLWAGLGYYRRARHLHLAAQRMVELHGGRVPETLEALLSLPGIGRYTAGAVGSIAFGLPAPVVDGNVMRVIARLTGFEGDIGDAKNAAFFWGVAGEILKGAGGEKTQNAKRKTQNLGRRAGAGLGVGAAGLATPEGGRTPPDGGRPPSDGGHLLPDGVRYGDVNQAMMELGATVCTPPPGRPACGICPVREFCRAFAEGRQGELPVKRKKGAVAVVKGVALVVTRNSNGEIRMTKRGKGSAREVLVMQRPRGVVWEEMWEMPVVEASGQWSVASGQKGEAASGMGVGKEKREGSRKIEKYTHELHGDMSIKNGHGVVMGGGGWGTLAGWVQGVLRVAVSGVVECGEVVHGLTHRRMEFLVVRGEIQNSKRKTQNAKRGRAGEARNLTLETRNFGGVLPVGAGMGGKRYVEWRWVKWPLEGRGEVPMARVVFKVAERAAVG